MDKGLRGNESYQGRTGGEIKKISIILIFYIRHLRPSLDKPVHIIDKPVGISLAQYVVENYGFTDLNRFQEPFFFNLRRKHNLADGRF